MRPWFAQNVIRREPHAPAKSRTYNAQALVLSLFLIPVAVHPQTKTGNKPSAAKAKTPAVKSSQTKNTPARPVDELTRLRADFIKATNEYKAILVKLRETYEKSVSKAQDKLTKSRELFAAGLISKREVEADEATVAQAQEKIAEVDQRMTGADSQIADTVLEAEAEKTFARAKPIPRGGFISTTAMIRFNGAAVWSLSDAWKVQQFFLGAFKKPLPVAVFGQGAIHDRWRLDHRNAMDISLHPDGVEGQALLGYLRANGIPFLAFRQAIPGTATGPHIHIGRPSHRY
ncbi:MAG: TolC family protein [Acidobacteriota bacterium]